MIALIFLIPAGILLGIFVNYLADVLPYTRRFSAPVCGRCGTRMGWGEYLLSPNCAQCYQHRRLRHWLLPLLGAGMVSVMWFIPPVKLSFWLAVVLLAYFTLVAITDIEYHAILNQVSIAGALIGLVAGFSQHTWWETLLGGAAAFAAMLLLYFLGGLFGKWIARRRGITIEDGDALGFGDVYLSGIIGLMLGYPAIVGGIFLGIVLGGVAGGLYLLYGWITKRYKAGTFLPYAPFLLAGAAVVLVLQAWQ